MRITELRKKNTAELNAELITLLRDQFNFRMQKALGQLNQTHLLKQTKRNIARIKTVLNEKTGI